VARLLVSAQGSARYHVVGEVTESEQYALRWLFDHNGEGTFTGRGAQFLAGGEIAHCTNGTWKKLRERGFIVKDGKRQRLTDAGRAEAETLPVHISTGRDDW